MNITAGRANCLDASALVKLYVNEVGSDILQQYIQNEATSYTTSLCYFEALNVLKVKCLYRKEITQEEYKKATLSLTAWFSLVSEGIRDLDFMSPSVFNQVQSIVEKYSLDLSDAFQILSVKEGFFSSLSVKSKTILVTADKNLAKATRQEGIRTWYFLTEPVPL